MGIRGVRQVRRETPESLERFAIGMELAARKLRDVAARMRIKNIYSVTVRYSPGAHNEMRKTVLPFVEDAEKKASRRGA